MDYTSNLIAVQSASRISDEKIDELRIDSTMKEVEGILSRMEGIIKIIRLTSKDVYDIRMMESDLTLSSGMEYENRAAEECATRDLCLCIFSEEPLERTDEITIIMADAFGNRTGNNVPDVLLEEYSKREDAVWLSDSFVLYPNAEQRSESRVIILPCRFKTFDSVGNGNAVSFYPTIGTDIALRKRFGIQSMERMTSCIVGINLE